MPSGLNSIQKKTLEAFCYERTMHCIELHVSKVTISSLPFEGKYCHVHYFLFCSVFRNTSCAQCLVRIHHIPGARSTCPGMWRGMRGLSLQSRLNTSSLVEQPLSPLHWVALVPLTPCVVDQQYLVIEKLGGFRLNFRTLLEDG